MKVLLICLFLFFTTRPGLCTLRKVDTFEFGQNMGQVSFTTSGSISLLEKIRRVSVTVPECWDLKYVRVDINHRFSPPAVKFDWETRTVIIEFRPLQYSVSQYTIIGKAVSDPYCGSGQVQQEYVPYYALTVK